MMTFKQLFTGISIAFVLAGCSAGPQEVAKADIQKATDNAKVVRSIYDKAQGKFDNVDEADKKKLVEIYKSEEGARKAFDLITNPPGGLPGAPAPNQ
ncbi:MAG: hypothetical protein JST12_20720 [Armatimonadetes bacterium]|nr:hypothetical protein [Armatimonadota bacterium]